MGKIIFLNVAVAVGSIIGSRTFGVVGWIAGAFVAFFIALIVCDQLEPPTTESFWPRHRNDFLMCGSVIIGIVIGMTLITGLVGWIGGWIAGAWVGGWLIEQPAPQGQSQATDAKPNMSLPTYYVLILTNAAEADGMISEKETAEIQRLTKQRFANSAFGSEQDLLSLVRDAPNHKLSVAQLTGPIAGIPPENWLFIKFDILRVLYCDGELSSAEERWLLEFQQMVPSPDWLIWTCFKRTEPTSSATDRSAWLSELDLPAHGNVSEEEIKRAYRKKATEYHPDKLQSVPLHIRALAEAKMVAINSAYQGLTDSGAPSRDYYFNHPTSQTTFTPSVAEEVLCACWMCEQANRIQSNQSKNVARCGNCHAFLGLESDPKKKSS